MNLVPFFLVVALWIFSVCLHEFGHAWVAFKGGDYTVEEKGYLSMNPLHYAHPVTSLVLPVLFVIMGGIGLPGGAVYIERHLLRSKGWETAVSLAGPAMNLAFALVLAALLNWVFIPHFLDNSATYALAFVLQLQICAILFNLLPIPPLDGFRAIEPWLPGEWKDAIMPYAANGLFIVAVLFWYVKPLNQALWFTVFHIGSSLGVDPILGQLGYQEFRFWEHPPAS